MGTISAPQPVLLLTAVFSRHPSALAWARRAAEAAWGPVAVESPAYEFAFTSFYEREMGPGLTKCFFAFQRLIDPARLADIKCTTNHWEQQYARQEQHAEVRPLNIDPGYLSEAKLVLASTKDRDHRIYLSRGIFAECTLYYHRGGWAKRPWTYPDYQTDEYHQFFTSCRNYLRQQLRGRP